METGLEGGDLNAGHPDGFGDSSIFRNCSCIHLCMRTAEVTMTIGTILMLAVSLFLLVYLIFALLRPEKF